MSRRKQPSPVNTQEVVVEMEEWNKSPKFPPRGNSPEMDFPPFPPSFPSLPSPFALSPPDFRYPSSPPSTATMESTDPPGDPKSATTSGYGSTTGARAKVKKGLQLKSDLLSLGVRRHPESSSSTTGSGGDPPSIPKSPRFPPKSPIFGSPSRQPASPSPKTSRSATPSKSPKMAKKTSDANFPTQSGTFYSVAKKDVSVLERIKSRAHKRALRVLKPHEVFIELEELRFTVEQGLHWSESARWIKFEEDVEEGTGLWGRPHISALAFHSLMDLRNGLARGLILLDMEGEDFPAICRDITDCLVEVGQLKQDSVEPVLKLLLQKHKHTIPVTLWEKLRRSAINPEGTLHQIGEELKRITSNTNLQDLTRGSRENVTEEGMTQEHSSGFLRRNASSEDKMKRESVVPLMEDGSVPDSPSDCSTLNETKPPPPQKKVMFNISGIGSTQSVDSLGNVHTGNSTVANSTQSTIAPNASLEIEVVGREDADHGGESTTRRRGSKDNGQLPEAAGPNPPLARRDSHSNTLEALQRNKSVLALMEKIPEGAESLTVLVGGVHFLKQPIFVLVRLAQSHLLGNLTEVPVPVRFIFLLLGPCDGQLDYHEIGRSMATLMTDKRFHEVAYSALSEQDMLDGMDEFLDDSIVLPPGDWDQDLLLPVMHERNELRRRKERKLEEQETRQLITVDPLIHSRKPCGGIWKDLTKLKKRYFSDYRDACNVQVLVSILFLYISTLAPAIAFGGLLEEITNNRMGESETLVSTGFAGIVYGLLAVQPLSILALTGPVLLFEKIVFEYSEDYHIPYLEWRACISLWLCVFILIFATCELTFLLKNFTRFAEEVLTGVIVVFFLWETGLSIIHVYERNPLCGIDYPCGDYQDFSNTCQALTNEDLGSGSGMFGVNISDEVTNQTVMDMSSSSPRLPSGLRICNQPNTALWSTILCLGTFVIAVLLRKLRQGKFLGKKGRRLVSDFGMLTAIMAMVLVAYIVRNVVVVETILVPPNLSVSNSTERGWFINPFGGRLTLLEGLVAVVPAFLVGILIFVENQLTVLHVNKPEHKLKKEVGYHFDLVMVGVLAAICGLFGMPWMSAASVRSLQHLQALSVFSKRNAPGEKPKLEFVHEQRITNIAIHFLIIITPLASPVLELIPLSVILGVFIYLAYASINGVQLKTRLKLLFTPTKHHPDLHFCRKVPPLKMHGYTIFQVVLVACLWTLKLSPASMMYPVAIVFLIPIRMLLGRFVYTHVEIEALDSEEDFPEDHEEEGEFGEFVETRGPY